MCTLLRWYYSTHSRKSVLKWEPAWLRAQYYFIQHLFVQDQNHGFRDLGGVGKQCGGDLFRFTYSPLKLNESLCLTSCRPAILRRTSNVFTLSNAYKPIDMFHCC